MGETVEQSAGESFGSEDLEPFELLHEALQIVIFTLFEHMGDQRSNPEEADPSALGAGGKTQGGSEMSFTRTSVTEKEHVFVLINIFPAHEFSHQRFVDRGSACPAALSAALESIASYLGTLLPSIYSPRFPI